MKLLSAIPQVAGLRHRRFIQLPFYIGASVGALVGVANFVKADPFVACGAEIHQWDFPNWRASVIRQYTVPAEARFSDSVRGDATYAHADGMTKTFGDRVPTVLATAFASIRSSGNDGTLYAAASASAGITDTMTISAIGLDGSTGTFSYLITPEYHSSRNSTNSAYSGLGETHRITILDGSTWNVGNEVLIIQNFVFGQPFTNAFSVNSTVAATYTGQDMFPPDWNGTTLAGGNISTFVSFHWGGVGSVRDADGNPLPFEKAQNPNQIVRKGPESPTPTAYIQSELGYDYTVAGVSIPAPVVAISTASSTAQLAFSNLVPTTEYRVMRSSNLSGWQEAHRFMATKFTDTWSEAITPGGKMFYRLEWNE